MLDRTHLSKIFAVAAAYLALDAVPALAQPPAIVIQTDGTAIVNGKGVSLDDVALMLSLDENSTEDRKILDTIERLATTNNDIVSLDAERDLLRAQYQSERKRSVRRAIVEKIEDITAKIASLRELINPTANELQALIEQRLG